MEIPQADSSERAIAAENLALRVPALRSCRSVSRPGVSLGLDRGNDDARGTAREGAVPIRAYRFGNVVGSLSRRGGHARRRISESNSMGSREPDIVGAKRASNPVGRGRRTDVRKERGAAGESL